MQTKINDYTSPSVYVVRYRSEGILCGSPSDPSIDAPAMVMITIMISVTSKQCSL